MMSKNLKLLLIVVCSALLNGCISYQLTPDMDDPNWAPAAPKLTDTSRSNPGAIYNPATAQMLFQDKKALQIGDLITVVLTENTNASKNADTELAKDSTITLPQATIFGKGLNIAGNPLSVDLGGSNTRSFKAETDSKQSNNLKGTITVTVHEVYPNGNLMINGEKWITLNQGSEFIRVAGIVRPEDIDKDNNIASTRVANARISYGGKGALAEANQAGWLSRFFNSEWWPF